MLARGNIHTAALFFDDGSMRDRTDISCYDDLHNARGLFMKHHFTHKIDVFF
jgi:hypothetical protein